MMTEMVIVNKKITVKEGVSASGKSYVCVTGVYPFDAEMTFECGQCFRFTKAEGESPMLFGCDTVYEGVAYGKFIRVGSPDLDTLVIEGASEADFWEIWYKYLGLDVDYGAIIETVKRQWGEDSRIARAAEAGCGIRIMAQEPWETLISFIISQNNNIPRIRGIIDRLCRTFGSSIPYEEEKYAFPLPRVLYEADVDGLFALKMGFRAKYVFDAAEKFTFEPDLADRVFAADTYEKADVMLRGIKGVGPKVSACTLLFGFGRMEAFPVDVWIRRTVGKYFPGEDPKEIDFGELAPYAGVIQQYIFNYERNCVSK